MMSTSKEEEFIGVLWLILTVLLIQNDIAGWWVVTLILGLSTEIYSICFTYSSARKRVKELKMELKIAEQVRKEKK